MTSHVATPDELLPPPPGSDDVLDDALVGLPAPPRARVRVLGGMLVAISVLCGALAFQLREDVRFAFAPSTPVELGDGASANPMAVAPNTLVRLRAAPQMAGAVHYSRPFYPGEHLVFPVAGRTGQPIYVQADGELPEDGVYVGRLLTFSSAGGRYARVGRFLNEELNAPVSGETRLLVTDATPRSLLWAPVLAAFLLALAITDLGLLARLLRPANSK